MNELKKSHPRESLAAEIEMHMATDLLWMGRAAGEFYHFPNCTIAKVTLKQDRSAGYFIYDKKKKRMNLNFYPTLSLALVAVAAQLETQKEEDTAVYYAAKVLGLKVAN